MLGRAVRGRACNSCTIILALARATLLISMLRFFQHLFRSGRMHPEDSLSCCEESDALLHQFADWNYAAKRRYSGGSALPLQLL